MQKTKKCVITYLVVLLISIDLHYYSAGICLIKVNNRNTRTRCEICSKLTIKAPRTTSNLLSHFTEFCIGQPDKITAISNGKIIEIFHKMKVNLKT